MTTTNASSTRATLLSAARDELSEKGEAALSLRAVARRAELSHAAPAHFFGDKAGLLTALAAEGFERLTAELDGAADLDDSAEVDSREGGERQALVSRLGSVYVEFGLRHPALIDLMFRGSLLRRDDPALNGAKQAAIGRLARAVAQTGTADAAEWTLISWALVHGLVVLSREQAVAPLLAARFVLAGGPAAEESTEPADIEPADAEPADAGPPDDAGAASALVERYVARVFAAGGAVNGSDGDGRGLARQQRSEQAGDLARS